MSTSAPDTRPTRAVICSNCGNVTGEFSRETTSALGECCRNLPQMWPVGGPGAPEVIDDEYEADETPMDDERPHCGSCGAMEFIIRERQTIRYRTDTEEYDLDCQLLAIPSGYGDTDTDDVEINCDNCGTRWHGEYEWE